MWNSPTWEPPKCPPVGEQLNRGAPTLRATTQQEASRVALKAVMLSEMAFESMHIRFWKFPGTRASCGEGRHYGVVWGRALM